MTAEENIAFQNGMIVGMVQKGVLVAEGSGEVPVFQNLAEVTKITPVLDFEGFTIEGIFAESEVL